MNYSLTINLTESQHQQLMASGYRIVVLKSNGRPTNMIWLNFSPLMQNIVTWNSNLNVYMSKDIPYPGTTISITSAVPAVAGHRYVCANDGITDLGQSVWNDDFSVYNDTEEYISAGFSQNAIVNGLPCYEAQTGDLITMKQVLKMPISYETLYVGLSNTQTSGSTILKSSKSIKSFSMHDPHLTLVMDEKNLFAEVKK